MSYQAKHIHHYINVRGGEMDLDYSIEDRGTEKFEPSVLMELSHIWIDYGTLLGFYYPEWMQFMDHQREKVEKRTMTKEEYKDAMHTVRLMYREMDKEIESQRRII